MKPVVVRSGQQRGVALVTVLLIVVLATLASLALVRTNEMAVQRSRNTTYSLQAAEYARGLEAWARIFLQRDLEESGYDSRAEIWAVPLPALEVTGGAVTGRLLDLDGRFNINVLASDNPTARERFQRLLEVLGIRNDLTPAIEDWLDDDAVARPGGAEDFVYQAQQPPYRAANQLMTHISELRLVAGVDAETFAILAPHVIALPPEAELNVNTASVPVLMALHASIDQARAERLHDAGLAEFRNLRDFKEAAGLRNNGFDDAGLSTRSQFFLAQAQVELGETNRSFYSVIQRHDYARFSTIERATGRY